jgi:hypothetical protein
MTDGAASGWVLPFFRFWDSGKIKTTNLCKFMQIHENDRRRRSGEKWII